MGGYGGGGKEDGDLERPCNIGVPREDAEDCLVNWNKLTVSILFVIKGWWVKNLYFAETNTRCLF